MRARVAAAVLLGLALIAAGAAYLVSTTSTGVLTVRIRDVPVAWSHVVLTFSEVAVQPAGASGAGDWRDVPLQTTRIDFLTLGNLTTLLALGHLAPGAYAGIRVIVSSVSGVLASGTPVAMSLTNGALAVSTAFTLSGGATSTVTLDLNLPASIQQTGLGWSFTPVLGPVAVA